MKNIEDFRRIGQKRSPIKEMLARNSVEIAMLISVAGMVLAFGGGADYGRHNDNQASNSSAPSISEVKEEGPMSSRDKLDIGLMAGGGTIAVAGIFYSMIHLALHNDYC